MLHLSDTQFGQYHRFGDGVESLAGRLIDDLDANMVRYAAGVDAIVISGDITERALPGEFSQARQFVEQLTKVLGLTPEDVVIVPGNHDVNWKACEAFCCYQESKGETPKPPFEWKWSNYLDFQREVLGCEELYGVRKLPRIDVAIAYVNSTVQETHQNHWGHCGEAQLRELAAGLRPWSDLYRIAVLHHNVRRKAENDDENLRDEDDFTRILAPEIDLVLHGHTHDGRKDRLSEGTLVLSAGSAAVNAKFRPGEVPNQFQLLVASDGWLTRVCRRYEPDQKRFTLDNRIGTEESPGIEKLPMPSAANEQPTPRHRTESGLVLRRLGLYG